MVLSSTLILSLCFQYRQSHVDFATVKGIEIWRSFPFMISSYDINCQYGKSFLERISEWVDTSEMPLFRRCVPKYHLIGHKEGCHWYHSFWFMPGVGVTDGEAPKRRWASSNAIARSTREMSSGHRHDISNLHSGDYNIQKTFNMGTSFLYKSKLNTLTRSSYLFKKEI